MAELKACWKLLYGGLWPIVYAALALSCAALLSACAPSAPEAPKTDVKTLAKTADPASADTLILAFGDSLYAGYNLKPGESFPAKLEAALRAEGANVAVRNAGVSGDTSAAGRQRFAYALDNMVRKPDLVIIGLGGNDMLRGISPDQTRENMTAMLDELKQRGIPAMLTGMLAAPNLGNDYVSSFNGLYPELAKEYNAPLYPFFLDGVLGKTDLMLPDGVHPNAKGVDMIVGKVAPMVAEALEAKAE